MTVLTKMNSFYDAVGFTGNTALLISAIYGFMGVIGQIISLTLVAGMSPCFDIGRILS